MDIMKVVSNIVIGVIGTALTLMVTWMVKEVASMSDIKSEIRYMNKNLEKVNETMQDSNKRLDTFNANHSSTISIMTKAIAVNSSEINSVRRMCERTEQDVEKCRDIHFKEVPK